MKKPMIMFAPDDAPAAGAAPVSAPLSVPEVPAAASHPAAEIVEVPAAPGVIKAAEEIGLVLPGVKGPKEMLGDDSVDEMKRMEDEMVGAKEGRKRGPDGKFLPKEGEPAKPAKAQVKPPAPAKPVTPPTKTEKPVAATVVPEPKIKIGEKEMTASEIAKALEDKAKPAEVPAPTVEKKPEEIAAEKAKSDLEAKERDDQYIARTAEKFKMTPEEHDTILAGGPEAVEANAKFAARIVLESQKETAQQVNSIVNAIYDRIDPLVKHQQQIEEYRTNAAFLEAHPDIKADARGLVESITVRKQLHDEYDRIQAAISQGKATKDEQGWSLLFEATTPSQFEQDVAHYTRQRLKIATTPAAQVAPVAAVPATPVAPKPVAAKPFNGERPGGATAPRNESKDARELREMNEREGIAS